MMMNSGLISLKNLKSFLINQLLLYSMGISRRYMHQFEISRSNDFILQKKSILRVKFFHFRTEAKFCFSLLKLKIQEELLQLFLASQAQEMNFMSET